MINKMDKSTGNTRNTSLLIIELECFPLMYVITVGSKKFELLKVKGWTKTKCLKVMEMLFTLTRYVSQITDGDILLGDDVIETMREIEKEKELEKSREEETNLGKTHIIN